MGSHNPQVKMVKMRCNATSDPPPPLGTEMLMITVAVAAGVTACRCSVHRVPSQYRSNPGAEGSGYQFAGVTGGTDSIGSSGIVG